MMGVVKSTTHGGPRGWQRPRARAGLYRLPWSQEAELGLGEVAGTRRDKGHIGWAGGPERKWLGPDAHLQPSQREEGVRGAGRDVSWEVDAPLKFTLRLQWWRRLEVAKPRGN